MPEETDRLASLLVDRKRVLVIGIGGGGDVVGALDSALLCRALGCDAIVGGVSWERLPIDPEPGPRSLAEIEGAKPLADSVMLVDGETRTHSGVRFAESHMARFLERSTLLVDPGPGPSSVAADLATAAESLEADLVIGVDVGGDVLSDGSEPGLGSPLCDALMLAAMTKLEHDHGTPVALGVFGPCCDGELTMAELLVRVAAVAAAGGFLGARAIQPDSADELARAIEVVPTEASAQAVRCARGELGQASIRHGWRSVPLSPLGATTFYLDPATAVETAAVLARAMIAARDLEHANEILHDLGVRTELDYERDNAPAQLG